MAKKGLLIVVSGPSGVGKDTIVNKYISENDGVLSVSATTRNKREHEKDGVDYYFLTKEEFEEKINQGDFLEYATYNNCYYGTPKSKIDEILESGRDVFLVIEVQGGLQIKEKVPDSLLIFILPPSFEELEKRLRNRATDSEEMIQNRLEIAKTEVEVSKEYDYRITNNNVDEVVSRLKEIIESNK